MLMAYAASISEDLAGEPQTVRVEQQDYHGENTSTTLQESTTYYRGGKIAERRVYRPDGTLSCHELYEYGDDGQTSTARIFDSDGRETHIRKMRVIEPGTEETTSLDPAGKLLERSITRRDDAGRIVQSTLTNLETGDESHLSVQYAEGGLMNADATFDIAPGLAGRFEMVRRADGSATTTLYGDNGTVLTKIDITGDTCAEGDRIVERIDSRDAKGNWTKKTTFERDSLAGVDVPTAVKYRTSPTIDVGRPVLLVTMST